jgi:hypothetical protein
MSPYVYISQDYIDCARTSGLERPIVTTAQQCNKMGAWLQTVWPSISSDQTHMRTVAILAASATARGVMVDFDIILARRKLLKWARRSI